MNRTTRHWGEGLKGEKAFTEFGEDEWNGFFEARDLHLFVHFVVFLKSILVRGGSGLKWCKTKGGFEFGNFQLDMERGLVVDCDRKRMQQVSQVGGRPVKKGLVDEDKPVNITTGAK